MSPQILIAGIGNVFLGDDAFGVEVVAELARRDLPGQVRVCDFGIRGLDLTYALLDGFRSAILVDAVARGGTPGDLFVIEPEPGADSSDNSPEEPLIDTHAMNPDKVLRLVRAMGGVLDRVLVVGCEPEPLDQYDEMETGLSHSVRAAVPRAADLVLHLAAEMARSREMANVTRSGAPFNVHSTVATPMPSPANQGAL